MDDKIKYGGGRSLNAIWDSNLDTNQTIVMQFIGSQCDFRDFSRSKWISISKIAKKTRLSERSVFRVIRQLVEQGYLIKTQRFTGKRNCQSANEYTITSKIFDEYMASSPDTQSPLDVSSPDTQSGPALTHSQYIARGDTQSVHQDSNCIPNSIPSSVCSLSAPARDNDPTHIAPENKIVDIEEMVETYWSNETPRGEFVTRKAMTKQFKRMINGYDLEKVKAVLEECFAQNHYRPLAWDLALFSQILVSRVGGFNIDTS